jgi:hypothetical protein
MVQGEWGVGCTNRRHAEQAGPMLIWPNLGFRQPMQALVCLGLFYAGSFGVVRMLWVISSVCALELQEISPTLVQKGTLLIREPGSTLFELKYFFYFHHETYSNKAELKLHQHKQKRIYLRWTVEGWYLPPSYIVQHESNALTYLSTWIQLNDSPVWIWRFFLEELVHIYNWYPWKY